MMEMQVLQEQKPAAPATLRSVFAPAELTLPPSLAVVAELFRTRSRTLCTLPVSKKLSASIIRMLAPVSVPDSTQAPKSV